LRLRVTWLDSNHFLELLNSFAVIFVRERQNRKPEVRIS
jgi:hypothetical protein